MHDREALHQKAGKTNFDLIYDLEDPREYFNTLGGSITAYPSTASASSPSSSRRGGTRAEMGMEPRVSGSWTFAALTG